MSGLSTVENGLMHSDLGKTIVGTVAAATALKGIGAATQYTGEKLDRRKFNKVIDYAKKRHPELRSVPHDRMMNQMNAFYALAPRVSTNKELGASMLLTTNDYGGNVDLATAKMISEIGDKSHKQDNSTNDVISFINTGRNLSKR